MAIVSLGFTDDRYTEPKRFMDKRAVKKLLEQRDDKISGLEGDVRKWEQATHQERIKSQRLALELRDERRKFLMMTFAAIVLAILGVVIGT